MEPVPEKKEEDSKPNLNLIGMLITIPFVLAVPPVVGLLIGMWLDGIFGTDPILMAIFLILGLVAGIREFYKLLKKAGSAK